MLLKDIHEMRALMRQRLEERFKGGPGSGHHGHAGRPGQVGGSTPGTGGVGVAAHAMIDTKSEETRKSLLKRSTTDRTPATDSQKSYLETLLAGRDTVASSLTKGEATVLISDLKMGASLEAIKNSIKGAIVIRLRHLVNGTKLSGNEQEALAYLGMPLRNKVYREMADSGELTTKRLMIERGQI